MNITSFASSSSGNLYLLEDENKRLLIECGLPIKQIRKHLKFNMSLDGCLLSHAHMDHAKSASDIIKSGIDLYCSNETAQYLKINGHHRCKRININQFSINKNWIIRPFIVEHDIEGSRGFLIKSGKNKILFATDTYFLRYKFKGLTHIMIECNWSELTLSDDIEPVVFNRLVKSHMSLETCIRFFKANDLSKVQEIHLLHLSNDNSDQRFFKKTIQRLTGIPVYII